MDSAMYSFGMRQLVTWLLVLAIGHIPVPCVHNHAWLKKEQLESHLSAFHQVGCVPQGWHMHVIRLGAKRRITTDGVSNKSQESGAVDQRREQPLEFDEASVAVNRRPRDGQGYRPWYDSVDSSISRDFFIVERGNSKPDKAVPPPGEASLFNLYCSLLL